MQREVPDGSIREVDGSIREIGEGGGETAQCAFGQV